jgi:hypothetical protein
LIVSEAFVVCDLGGKNFAVRRKEKLGLSYETLNKKFHSFNFIVGILVSGNYFEGGNSINVFDSANCCSVSSGIVSITQLIFPLSLSDIFVLDRFWPKRFPI